MKRTDERKSITIKDGNGIGSMTSSRTKKDVEKSSRREQFPKTRSQSAHGSVTDMLERSQDADVKTTAKKRHKRIKPPNSLYLDECRRIYRDEMCMLWREVEEFRVTCQRQMDKQREQLEDHRRSMEQKQQKQARDSHNTEDNTYASSRDGITHKQIEKLSFDHFRSEQYRIHTVPDLPTDFTKELKKLEQNMSLLEKKQQVLDKEQTLIEKEEHLAKKQEQLQEYEKDVEEVENMLDKRQSMCNQRTKDVEILNDDLLTMKRDLEESVDEIFEASTLTGSSTTSMSGTNTASTSNNSVEASTNARRNWSFARKHLLDKMTVLEATVQRYRTQLASATATNTAKDMMIARLNTQVVAVQDETTLKDKKIKQLEMQLSLTVEEKARSQKNFDMLLEELQTIEFSSTLKTQQLLQQAPEPSKQHMSFRQRLLRRQQSSLSFFNSDVDKTSSPKNSKKETKQRKLSGSPLRSRTNHTLSNGDAPNSKIEVEDENKLSVLDKLRHHSDQNLSRKHGESNENLDSGSKACAIM